MYKIEPINKFKLVFSVYKLDFLFIVKIVAYLKSVDFPS